MTVRDVARRTGKSQKTIYRYIRNGKLDAELVTTPQGHLYLIDEKAVTDAGLSLVQEADRPPSPVGGSDSISEQDALRYFQQQLEELRAENARLREELKRTVYIAGVYRGRLDQLSRRLHSSKRGRTDLERLLVQARNDAAFYREKATSRSRFGWSRIFRLI